MRCRFLTAACVSLVVCGAPCAGDDAKKELKSLEGSWEYASILVEGKKVVFPEGKRLRLVIKGDTYTLELYGKRYERGTLAVDPAKQPKALDMTATEGKGKGDKKLGIYEIKGDQLRACLALPGMPRPTTFAADPGSNRLLGEYRRVKAKP